MIPPADVRTLAPVACTGLRPGLLLMLLVMCDDREQGGLSLRDETRANLDLSARSSGRLRKDQIDYPAAS